jgi:Co/Zn/Cd efflux system component
MEGSPPGFPTDKLLEEIHKLAEGDDVIDIHDFHLWSISQGKMALSAHVRTQEPNRVLKAITALCQNKFDIDHCTIQIEDSSASNPHQFECEQTTHKTLEISSPSRKTNEGH